MQTRESERPRFAALRDVLRKKTQELAERDGLSVRWRVAICLLAALAWFTRSPGLFLHAQFYAEDGLAFYQNAYNSGWLHTLFLPQSGYLCLQQRLAIGPALLLPLQAAPLLLALIGLAFQCLPVAVLLGPRCRTWGPLTLRAAFIAIYVAIPNAREIHIVLTNAQWHLALAMIFLAFASPPATWLEYVTDAAIFLVGTVTGPFGALMLPFVMGYWWVKRQRWTLVVAAILGVGAVIQTLLVMSSTYRNLGPLGASFNVLLRMIGGDIVAGAMLNGRPFWTKLPLPLILAAVGLGLLIWGYCIRKAALPLRLFALYSLAMLALSLRSPLISGPKPRWLLLVTQPGARYWFFPMLAFLWGAVWCAMHARDRLFRVAGRCVLVVLPIGIVAGWEYKPYGDEHFSASVKRLQDAPVGTHVIIPIAPHGRQMDLIKRDP